MAWHAGDDPFDLDFGFGEDGGDDDEFCYDPFDDYVGGGEEGDDLMDGPFAVHDGDGEVFCVSGLAIAEVDDALAAEDHASRTSHEGPGLETLGRSFDSDDGGLGQLLSHLAEDTSEDGDVEVVADHRAGGGFELERGHVVEESADDGDDDGGDALGLMLGGFSLDPRRFDGAFQTMVVADEELIGDDDMGEGGGFALGPPPVAGAFRMVVGAEDTDFEDADFSILEVLAGGAAVGEATSARGLPASRAVVAALPEVALSEEEASHGCAVCKDGIAAGESVVRLPCKHYFHGDCIRPWLAIRNTCPVCRFELPTGDPEYDWRRGMAGVETVARQGAPAQSGAAVGAEAATECSGGNADEQGASR